MGNDGRDSSTQDFSPSGGGKKILDSGFTLSMHSRKKSFRGISEHTTPLETMRMVACEHLQFVAHKACVEQRVDSEMCDRRHHLIHGAFVTHESVPLNDLGVVNAVEHAETHGALVGSKNDQTLPGSRRVNEVAADAALHCVLSLNL